MTSIRRFYIPDSIVFITCVTKNREKILCSKTSLDVFWSTFNRVKDTHPFDLYAYSILPDHFHLLIRPLNEVGDYSRIVHSLKRNFTLNYKKMMGIAEQVSFWQPKFWDHIIRDEKDLHRQIDYIHWNAVKHGYSTDPEGWEHSSYLLWQD